jgi:NADH dehydrogenase/NADH:ubiquinone oxidoreductase subunit G
MSDFKAVLDGTEVRGHEGMTILEAAEQVDIHIPTLCHSPDLTPEGNCRICVVEVEGSPRLVASCHTPIADGMVIHTHSPKVLAARKAILELLLTGHTGPCVTDECAKDCELHNLAAELEVGPPRFQVKKRRFYPVEEISPYVQRDMSRCILCRRCVRACVEIAKKNIFSVAYRGFKSKVVVDCDVALDKEACRDCGICIDYCPTSALGRPKKGVT